MTANGGRIGRREFLATTALAAGALAARGARAADAPRPNILWITSEDTSPWFGFCGDAYATTPNLDRLARGGVHYTKAFATAPVCSPARFCLITGFHANAMGAQHLRAGFPIPDWVHGLPARLREAGYHCTNNVKTDYNCAAEKRLVAESWDACSGKAHWRSRKPGQPFFAIFNLMQTHQSWTGVTGEAAYEKQIGAILKPEERHDPAKAPVPPYYPDTPVVRKGMARVYDCITAMDRLAGGILDQLEKDGLSEDTIVFFYPDHGQGIPRGKRTTYDTGLHVPLVIRFPEKFKALAPSGPGTTCDRLVSFVDFHATALSLAGVPQPERTQARPFLGPAAGAPREYVYAARDRVDEALDVSRSVRDGRFHYVRNYMPHLSWNSPEGYSDQSVLRQEIARVARAGGINDAQLSYAGPSKPVEALFDTAADPWELRNLAADPAHAATLRRMRAANRDWLAQIRDTGFFPEWRMAQLAAAGTPPWDAAHDEKLHPFARILETAELVGRPGTAAESAKRLSDPDPSVRWWAAVGLRAAGAEAAVTHGAALETAVKDDAPPVRIEAAGCLAVLGGAPAATAVLAGALRSTDPHEALLAARTLQLLGPKARPALAAMKEALAAAKEAGDHAMYMRFSLKPAVEALEG
jgi:arylsulfatase A-like enzyme